MTKKKITDEAIFYRNRITGQVYESRPNVRSRFIDGIEFIPILQPNRQSTNYVRKDQLELVKQPVAVTY